MKLSNNASTVTHTQRKACLLAIVTLAPLWAGCQSTGIRAASMPAELRVAPTAGSHQMQLANLAVNSTRSTTLNPGDLLEVRVASGIEETPPEPLVVQVTPRGDVDLPLVGPVIIAGLEPSDASEALVRAAIERGVYMRPNITLEVRQRATHQVTVLGAVSEPGVHELPVGGCDVLSAIAAAGGLTEEAGTDVEVMRQSAPSFLAAKPHGASPQEGAASEDAEVQQVAFNSPPVASAAGFAPQPAPTPRVERINLAQAFESRSSEQRLADRSVVFVPPKQKRVIHVTGLVTKPDQFELPDDQDVRVLDAIAMAGGRSSPVADKVFVIRQRDAGETEPAVITVSVAKAKQDGRENLILGPGDLVSVESTVTTTMVDAVRDFFRVSVGLTSTAFAF
ncbi:MAG: SLBB domain-containing protein [Planctomycetota bacterium]